MRWPLLQRPRSSKGRRVSARTGWTPRRGGRALRVAAFRAHDLLFEDPHAPVSALHDRWGPGEVRGSPHVASATPLLVLLLAAEPPFCSESACIPWGGVTAYRTLVRVGTEAPPCFLGTEETRGQGTIGPVRQEALSAGESCFSGKERRRGGRPFPLSTSLCFAWV